MINKHFSSSSSYHLDALPFLCYRSCRAERERVVPTPKPSVIDFLFFLFVASRETEDRWSVFVYLERFHALDKRYRELESTSTELKQLNVQLEKDLLSVGGVSALFRRGPEVNLARSAGPRFRSLSLFRDRRAIAIPMKRRSSRMCWINRRDPRTPSKSRRPSSLRVIRVRTKHWRRSWSASVNDFEFEMENWRAWERPLLSATAGSRWGRSRKISRWNSRLASFKMRPTSYDRTTSSSTKRSNSFKIIQ